MGKMLKYKYTALALSLSTVLFTSGCSLGTADKPVEITMKNVPEYYSDELTQSDTKKLNYQGYFLGDKVSIEEGLDLNSEILDTLVSEWEWSILQTDYMGNPLELGNTQEDSQKKRGISKTLSGIVGSETLLEVGQVLQIVPKFGVYKDKEGNEVEQKKTFDYILVANYGKKKYKIKQCVNVGWYTVFLNNYSDCFKIEPMENENIEVVPDSELFRRISEQLGSPTTMWERPMKDEDYVKGVRNVVFAYEYPLYTILADVVESSEGESIQSMYYIPDGLWLESKWYGGMKRTYREAYYEIDKTELPEVTKDDEEE